MHHAGLGDRLGPDGRDRVRQAREAVADDHEHLAHAPILDLGEHVRPVTRSLPDPAAGHRRVLPGPQPKDISAALAGDRERDVDGAG